MVVRHQDVGDPVDAEVREVLEHEAGAEVDGDGGPLRARNGVTDDDVDVDDVHDPVDAVRDPPDQVTHHFMISISHWPRTREPGHTPPSSDLGPVVSGNVPTHGGGASDDSGDDRGVLRTAVDA